MIRRIKQRAEYTLEQLSVRATKWIGSTNSLLVHTVIFITAFVLYFYGIPIDTILLVLTTIVSLEAIYLSIFIQMSVNRQARKLHAVAKDVDEIQGDIDEIQGDIDEIQEDVEDIQEEDEKDDLEDKKEDETLIRMEDTLGKLIEEVLELKKLQSSKNKKLEK